MTVQSVIQEVCAFIGVRPPQGSVFVSPYVDRTAWELVQLANEMAQRIAYDTRDWQVLNKLCTFSGTEVIDPITAAVTLKEAFELPPDWQRMLLSAQVWRSTNPQTAMNYVSDPDEWLQNELQNYIGSLGEWIILNNEMHIRPALAALVPANPGDPLAEPPVPATNEIPAETVKFFYMRNSPIRLAAGGFGAKFMQDGDTFLLSERLLKLAMIWQWKAYKGATYAEDLANYEDALAKVAGADKPSPIIVDGRRPVMGWGSDAIYY